MSFQFRQGDVFGQRVDEIPTNCKLRKDGVLAEGEVTGHKHRISTPSDAKLWEAADGNLYMEVGIKGATIVHDEHGPVALAQGLYRVWGQREYSPDEIRRVID